MLKVFPELSDIDLSELKFKFWVVRKGAIVNSFENAMKNDLVLNNTHWGICLKVLRCIILLLFSINLINYTV